MNIYSQSLNNFYRIFTESNSQVLMYKNIRSQSNSINS